MECPRDQCTMTPQRQGKYPRFECPMCSGLYVAEREVMQLLGYKDDRRFEGVAKVKVANVKDSDIKCPEDGTTLKAVKYLNTELDVCPKCHALWFDYGEYEKIVRRLGDEVHKLRDARRRDAPKEVIEYVDEPVTVDSTLESLGGILDWVWIWRKIL